MYHVHLTKCAFLSISLSFFSCTCPCPRVPVPVSLSLSFCPRPYTFVPLTLSLYPVPVCLSQSLPMSKVKGRITIEKKGEGSLVHLVLCAKPHICPSCLASYFSFTLASFVRPDCLPHKLFYWGEPERALH